MIQDLGQMLALQANTYDPAPAGEVYDAGEDRLVLTRFDKQINLAIRGTVNTRGWFSDFLLLPHEQRASPAFGVGHKGFMDGAEALWQKMGDKIPSDPSVSVRVIGHSRGAGIAPWIVAYLLQAGIRPSFALAIEKPWTCGRQLRNYILNAGVAGAELWHGNDPVPAAPALSWLVPNVWPVKHFGAWKVDPFDCHHMPGIVADQGLVI